MSPGSSLFFLHSKIAAVDFTIPAFWDFEMFARQWNVVF